MHRRALTAVLLTLALSSVEPLAAEDWPQFRGPTGQGISTETGLPVEWSAESGVAWRTPVPGQGWSSPVVYGERVFVTTATEEGRSFRLLCLDRATGEVLWDREVFQQSLESRLQQGNSYATPTPVTDGTHTYVLAFDGSVAAVANDGSIAWTNRDYPYYGQHGLAVSPRLFGGLLVVQYDGSSRGEDKRVGFQKPWDKSFLVALDGRTGALRWRASRGLSRIGHVTPNLVRHDGREVVVSGAGDVIQGFDLASGERLWTARSQGEGVVPSVVVGDGLVYTASGFEKPTIRAVRLGGRGDVTETHMEWEQTRSVPMMPSFLYVAPHLFTITESGLAQCLDARTGEVLGRRRIGGKHSASPIYAEGRIYFLAESGETTVVEATPEMAVVAKSTIPEHTQASMAVSGGHILLRTEMAVYSLGPGERSD
jgi:outer membrane protein assembly factor BamB